MINRTENEFTDISSEEWREYLFGNGERFRLMAPLKLSVSASGGHRLLGAGGISYYVPPKWLVLSWKAKDGQPNFVK